ncbi:hypothetical protein PSEUDO9AG_20053 [Pseudomonas sp. 9Ag]|nr:hypothetical protein PSEUDO9AG_20053 [Pseudomonas sp. 9Ag]
MLLEDGALNCIALAADFGIAGFTGYTGLDALVWIGGRVALSLTISFAVSLTSAIPFTVSLAAAFSIP